MSRPIRVLVAGALANKPDYGGEAWVRLAWIRGLLAMGVDTFFVERLAPGLLESGTDGTRPQDGAGRHRAFFERVIERFDLGPLAALLGPDDRVLYGPDRALVGDIARDADLLVNISGHLRPGDPLFEAVPRRAYIDVDPGFTQIWYRQGLGELGLDAHQTHFTVGWNVGSDGCTIPTGGLGWVPIRQPVLLDAWPDLPIDAGAPFTTVASWRGAFGRVEFGGRSYGQKAHEFRKLVDLPSRVGARLELALDIHPGDHADRTRLEAGGWHLTDPRRVSSDPDAFREYLMRSLGELSPVQGIYAETESGWFSDRSARYLALGRPVVVQDTGLGRSLPLGEGLFVFRTPDEAVRAVDEVLRDPDRHGRAARRIAEESFDARRILPEVLERALSAPGRGAVSGPTRSEPMQSGPTRSEPTRFTPTRSRSPAGRKESTIVSGMVAGVPGQGGASWAVLQYVLGLLRMGYDTHFVEEVEASSGSGPAEELERSRRWAYLERIARRFGLEGRVSLIEKDTWRTAGRTRRDLEALAERSRLLVNLSGGLTAPWILGRLPLRLYVDLDPAFTQVWHEQGIDVGLDGHTHFATVGLSLGTDDCAIPTCGRDWIRILPPVVLDEWTGAEAPPTRDAWTTVSHWRGYGSVDWNGVRLGQKAHAFRPLMPLPDRSGDRFEVALAIHPDEVDDLRDLRAHGWDLVDPEEAAGDPDRYRRFVAESAAEIGVAKDGYVVSRSGWFSDRSACYLASGRPVVAQDTGFSHHIPTGSGLLAFGSLDEAAEQVASVRRDYADHARAARAFAEAHLDAESVLSELVSEVER